MIVLGLVGSPAGGKSTAAEYLASLGAEWINADRIARECLNDPEVVAALTEHFGDGILASDGHIARGKLAPLVFGTDSVRRTNLRYLESQVHPKTRREILSRVAQAAGANVGVVLLDVPLLFESGWDLGCDSIWCIDATRENRLRRSTSRRWDADELNRREANQMAIETKTRLSQVVVRNDATLKALHQNLRCHWEELAKIGDTARDLARYRDRHCLSDRTKNSRNSVN